MVDSEEDTFILKWARIAEFPKIGPKKDPKNPKEFLFKCSSQGCRKVFEVKKKFLKHLKTHKEKIFPCKFKGCEKVFPDNSKLKRHTLVHTKEKNYQCEICKKRFSLDFNLKTHIRTHTGQKPYACDHEGCNKRFTQKSNLTAHFKIHSKLGIFFRLCFQSSPGLLQSTVQ